jgi:hypothetical protein
MAQTYFPGRPGVVPDLTNPDQHRKQIARAVNGILQGKSGNTMSITLTPSATSTTVTDSRISLSTALHLTPTTPAAATALPGIFIVATDGQAVISHPSSAATNQTFTASIQG